MEIIIGKKISVKVIKDIKMLMFADMMTAKEIKNCINKYYKITPLTEKDIYAIQKWRAKWTRLTNPEC